MHEQMCISVMKMRKPDKFCISGISALNELHEIQGLQLRRAASTRSAASAFMSLSGAMHAHTSRDGMPF